MRLFSRCLAKEFCTFKPRSSEWYAVFWSGRGIQMFSMVSYCSHNNKKTQYESPGAKVQQGNLNHDGKNLKLRVSPITIWPEVYIYSCGVCGWCTPDVFNYWSYSFSILLFRPGMHECHCVLVFDYCYCCQTRHSWVWDVKNVIFVQN